jgi:hypothetical protein
MEQIYFLILLAVVGLVRWLTQVAEDRKNAEAERQARGPSANVPTPVSRAPAQTEEERVRKFMEALGMPTSSAPPPPVQPRPAERKAAQPDRKFLPVDPFPVPTARRPQEPPPVVVVAPPPVVQAPPAPIAPPPLPNRETTVFTEPLRPSGASRTSSATFEVQDLDASAAEDQARDSRLVTSSRAATASSDVTSVAGRLANAQGLRDAIVLREIFGPPRSMQPLDPVR